MAGTNPRLSILGLYQWDQTLFDNLQLPEGLDHENVVDNILLELAELSVIYPEPFFMKSAIELWSASMLPGWTKLYEALTAEYNPLWNKDGSYKETETRNLKGTGKTEAVNAVTGYNSEDFKDATKGNTEGETTDTGTIIRDRTEKGNIGVTTSQAMLTEEMEVRSKYNMTQIIINDFKKRFCIMVY